VGRHQVFLQFAERFYPTFLAFPDSETVAGQRVYYDAAYGQRTAGNVLGLFAVGAQAEQYQAVEGDALRDLLLAELDDIFDGAASRTYLQHVSQDWSAEPLIRQAYVADDADWRTVQTLGEPIGDRIWFAGDAYTDDEDWSSVHVAARSARAAVEGLFGD
jgi:monoamine oxidase